LQNDVQTSLIIAPSVTSSRRPDPH
jgi:hypothetical protein